MNFNRDIIAGRLTRDPRLASTPNGHAVCDFGIAANTYSGGQEDAYFGEIVVFGKTAESCGRYLRKGSEALVEGRLKNESWEDKKTGRRVTRTRIIADRVEFGTPATGGDQQQYAPQTQQPAQPQRGYQTQPQQNQQSALGNSGEMPF